MTKTEERGWYVSDIVWTTGQEELKSTTTMDGDVVGASTNNSNEQSQEQQQQQLQQDDELLYSDPYKCMVPADESRDRCVICGINFKMLFDNDEYKYNNAREIEVVNDDDGPTADEPDEESMLVHVTCWKGLGSPVKLSMDQALHDVL